MKYLYTAVFLLFLSQGNAAAQEKSGIFDKIKGTFSSEIKIGTYTFKDGSVYTGEIKGRKPNGKGKTVFKNGDVYEGEYVKGKREGYGVYTFPDGERYDGQWFQDQQHGKGIYYFMNKKKVKMATCPNCNERIKEGSKFCPSCGQKLVAVCPKCGKEVEQGAKFCTECGEKLSTNKVCQKCN